MADYPEPRLEHLFDARFDLDAPQPIGASPVGSRTIFIVTGGTFEGPRMSGEALPGGGDWAINRNDGGIELDVRATLKTDDGALIYARYSGLILASAEVFQRIFNGEHVPLAEYYFYTNPMFQSGSEKYAWLNDRIAIGRGKAIRGGVGYRVWAVDNP